jgi:hypothetical protein
MTPDRKIAIHRYGKWSALAALALALFLSGCDKCGDWFGISRSQLGGGLEACKDTAPQPH